MESITMMDGLILTVVSMLTVFMVLAAIWGLVELVSKFVGQSAPDPTLETAGAPSTNHQTAPAKSQTSSTLVPNQEHQRVAELMALILASEDETDKKFEIVESKRVK